MESQVGRVLVRLLESGEPFGYEAVKQLAAPAKPEVPQLAALRTPNLGVYDALLVGAAR